MATMAVSYIPAAPLPMLASRSVGAVAPVASMMKDPETMPTTSTRKTLNPRMPPTSTRR